MKHACGLLNSFSTSSRLDFYTFVARFPPYSRPNCSSAIRELKYFFNSCRSFVSTTKASLVKGDIMGFIKFRMMSNPLGATLTNIIKIRNIYEFCQTRKDLPFPIMKA